MPTIISIISDTAVKTLQPEMRERFSNLHSQYFDLLSLKKISDLHI